jgi:hypothetical protein
MRKRPQPSHQLRDSFNALEQACKREGLATTPQKPKRQPSKQRKQRKPQAAQPTMPHPLHDGRAEQRPLAYPDYLRTKHWSIVRTKAVKRAGRKCEQCGSGLRLNVHHLTYEHLWYEYSADLRVLCETCHAITHGAFIYAG